MHHNSTKTKLMQELLPYLMFAALLISLIKKKMITFIAGFVIGVIVWECIRNVKLPKDLFD